MPNHQDKNGNVIYSMAKTANDLRLGDRVQHVHDSEFVATVADVLSPIAIRVEDAEGHVLSNASLWVKV